MITQQGYDLVSGWKKKASRSDFKTIPSKFLMVSTYGFRIDNPHDFNCGLKAYHHNVIKNIEYMVRCIVIFLRLQSGLVLQKIGEKVVEHRAQKFRNHKIRIRKICQWFS